MWAWLKVVGKWIGKAAIAYGPEVVGAVIESKKKKESK